MKNLTIEPKIETPANVGVVNVVYFPSMETCVCKNHYLNDMDDMEVVMNKFNPNSVHDIVRDGFTGKEFTGDEEELSNNIKTWIETLVEYSDDADDKQYYRDLLEEVIIISFVVKTEELIKVDFSFFDTFS